MRGGEPAQARQPKHVRLRDTLLRLMEGLPEGAPLPPERELCEAEGVSRQTVRQALQQLVAEGRVYRRQGSGTYVASRKIVQAVELADRHESGDGPEPGGGSRLIGVDRHAADSRLAQALDLLEGAEVLRIERLLMTEGGPTGVERLYVDGTRFDGLWESVAERDSLSSLFRDSHGLELADAEQTIEAVGAEPRDASLLMVALGDPLLLVTRRTLDSEGRPTHLIRCRYRGDRYRLTARTGPALNGPAATLVLRPARGADASVLARIFVQAWRTAYPGVVDDLVLAALDEDEMAGRFLSLIGQATARPNTLLAVRREEPVGFVRFGEDPDLPRVGHVFSLYVASAAMGQGVGRALLEEVLAELSGRGHQTVTLWVFEANSRARHLYQGMGFVPDGGRRVEAAYGAQEIRLRRDIGP